MFSKRIIGLYVRVMNLENRLRSDKKILIASGLLLLSILSRIIYACIVPSVYGDFIYIGYIAGSMISMIPNVLFLLHTLVFYKTEKPQKIFAISYIVLLTLTFINLLQGASLGTVINNILFVLSYGLMVFLSLRGTNNRKLSLVGVILPCVLTIISFIQMLSYVTSAMSYWGVGYLWMNLIYYMGTFALYVALFIIAPDTIKIKKDVQPLKRNLLEEQLVTLKQQFDAGEITEQEYNDKKKEILNNL